MEGCEWFCWRKYDMVNQNDFFFFLEFFKVKFTDL